MKRQSFINGFMLAVVAFMFLVPSLLMAQATRGQAPTPQSRVDEINKVVKLTADQQAQILKIYTDAAANAQQGGGGGGFMGGATTAAVEKVLNAAQLKAWQAYTLQQSIDRRITLIDQAVTFTADQKAKITPIIEKEIIATTALSTANAAARAQGQTPDMEAYRGKTTEIRGATDKALESILTKDQLQKYQSMPRGGRGGGGGGGRGAQ